MGIYKTFTFFWSILFRESAQPDNLQPENLQPADGADLFGMCGYLLLTNFYQQAI